MAGPPDPTKDPTGYAQWLLSQSGSAASSSKSSSGGGTATATKTTSAPFTPFPTFVPDIQPGQKTREQLAATGYISNPLHPDTQLVNPKTGEVYSQDKYGRYNPDYPLGKTAMQSLLQTQQAQNKATVPPIGTPTPTGAPANSLANPAPPAAPVNANLLSNTALNDVLNRTVAQNPRSPIAGGPITATPGKFANLPPGGVPDWVQSLGMPNPPQGTPQYGRDAQGNFSPFGITTTAGAPPIQLNGPQSININPMDFAGGPNGSNISKGWGGNVSQLLAGTNGMTGFGSTTSHPASLDPAVNALAAYVVAQSNPQGGGVPDWTQAIGASGLQPPPLPDPISQINQPMQGAGGQAQGQVNTAAPAMPYPDAGSALGAFVGSQSPNLGSAGNAAPPQMANGGTVITTHPSGIFDLVNGRMLAETSEYGQPERADVSASGIHVTPMPPIKMAAGGDVFNPTGGIGANAPEGVMSSVYANYTPGTALVGAVPPGYTGVGGNYAGGPGTSAVGTWQGNIGPNGGVAGAGFGAPGLASNGYVGPQPFANYYLPGLDMSNYYNPRDAFRTAYEEAQAARSAVQAGRPAPRSATPSQIANRIQGPPLPWYGNGPQRFADGGSVITDPHGGTATLPTPPPTDPTGASPTVTNFDPGGLNPLTPTQGTNGTITQNQDTQPQPSVLTNTPAAQSLDPISAAQQAAADRERNLEFQSRWSKAGLAKPEAFNLAPGQSIPGGLGAGIYTLTPAQQAQSAVQQQQAQLQAQLAATGTGYDLPGLLAQQAAIEQLLAGASSGSFLGQNGITPLYNSPTEAQAALTAIKAQIAQAQQSASYQQQLGNLGY